MSELGADWKRRSGKKACDGKETRCRAERGLLLIVQRGGLQVYQPHTSMRQAELAGHCNSFVTGAGP